VRSPPVAPIVQPLPPAAEGELERPSAERQRVPARRSVARQRVGTQDAGELRACHVSFGHMADAEHLTGAQDEHTRDEGLHRVGNGRVEA